MGVVSLNNHNDLALFFRHKEEKHLKRLKENLNFTLFNPSAPSSALDQKQWKALSAAKDRKFLDYYVQVIRPDMMGCSENSPKQKVVDQSFFPYKIPSKLKGLFLTSSDYTLERAQKGICRGIRDWFINLLISSLQNGHDVAAAIEALTKRFEEGAGKAEMLLQNLTLDAREKLIGLKSKQKGHIIDFQAFDRKFNRLRPGIYEYDLHFESSEQKIEGHACVLVKISDQLAYIFDPDLGALRREGKNLAELIFNHAQLTQQVVPLSDIVCSAITFRRVEKKGCSLEALFPSPSFWSAVAKFFSAWALLFRIFVGQD